MEIRVLGLLGSPHKDRETAQLFFAALKAAEFEGAKTEWYSLYDGEIKPCIGCIREEEPYCKFPCIFEDYGKFLLEKIYEADGIIFATPVYWFAPSGVIKNLIDRMTSLENMVAFGEPSYMEGKVVGVITTCADDGASFAGSYLLATLNSMGAILPPWAMAYSKRTKMPLHDNKALLDAVNIGLLIVRTIKRLNGDTSVSILFDDNKTLAEKIRKEVERELKITKDRITK